MRLQGCDKGMADLMVRNDLLFMVRQHGVFLLIARNDDFDTFFQVSFRHDGAVIAHGAQRGLIDHVGKLSAGRAGGHARDGVEVHIVGGLDLFRVDLQNGFASRKVRQLDGHTAVKAAGSRQCRVERFGPVRRGEDDDTVVALKAIHFGE